MKHSRHKTLCFPEVKKSLAGDYTAVEMFVKQLKSKKKTLEYLFWGNF
jgi:hypothetical protein